MIKQDVIFENYVLSELLRLRFNRGLKAYPISTLTHLKNQPFFTLPDCSGLKGKVDFSAFTLQGRDKKAEKSFPTENL